MSSPFPVFPFAQGCRGSYPANCSGCAGLRRRPVCNQAVRLIPSIGAPQADASCVAHALGRYHPSSESADTRVHFRYGGLEPCVCGVASIGGIHTSTTPAPRLSRLLSVCKATHRSYTSGFQDCRAEVNLSVLS